MKFADRTKFLKSSEIREMLKYSQMPDMISFSGGYPNPHAFPSREIVRIVEKIIDKNKFVLQYGPTEGIKELREALKKRMQKKGIKTDIDNIKITTGSQQGLFLLGEILINPGDNIVVESPTYLGALNAFSIFQPNYISIPIDENGMKIDVLEEKLKKEKIKFVYTIPTFQNPSGTTLSLDRRKYLLELAEKYDFFIIEDDPYSELRYSGENIKSIKSLDKNNLVIYLSTFSKILCPGFRLGWIIADEEIGKKFEIAKQNADLCSPNFTQYIAEEYINSGIIDKQIKLIRKMYKRKRDIMLNALNKYFPKNSKWTKPDGGMFIWVEFHENVDVKKLLEYAIKEKVIFISGAPFYATNPKYNTIRLNFTNTEDNLIEEGIKRLSQALKKIKEGD
ncbi:MAG: PLP-dependent aminotransferase family protein [Candidatus Aenigmatarchaeota archaeon]